MIYLILTLICAIFNLLCLVSIQAWQLALEGLLMEANARECRNAICWDCPLAEGARQHHAASVGWKPVNIHLLHPCKQRWREVGGDNTHLSEELWVTLSHSDGVLYLLWQMFTEEEMHTGESKAKRLKGAQFMKINTILHLCFESWRLHVMGHPAQFIFMLLNPE